MRREVEIHPMSVTDLDEVLQIERAVFPDPWSYHTFKGELRQPKLYSLIVAKINDQLVGYAGLLRYSQEGHITNLAVHPNCQGQGVGTVLALAVIDLALEQGIRNITLEVRKSNFKAQNLYKKFGFKAISIQKGYYAGTKEDGLIMCVDQIISPSYQERLETIRESLNSKNLVVKSG